MARAPNPKVKEAEELFRKGLKLIEIANRLEVPEGTVRRWKSTYKWDNERSEKENERSHKRKATKQPKKDIVVNDGAKELMQNDELTEKQKLFCLYYSKSFNATQSYLKAYECSYDTAHTEGYKSLANPCIKSEIERLKELKRQMILIGEEDMVEFHMRIAFADMGDYLSFGREEVPVIGAFGPIKDEEGNAVTEFVNTIKLKESNMVDTQLIKEIKQGKDGIGIKLLDRCKSLEWLDKYFLMNPMDKHKIEYENKLLEMQQKKLEPELKENVNKYNGIPATMIAPAFIGTLYDINAHEHDEYVFPGGRGSTKSSFISLVIVDILEKNSDMHAAVYRQVGDTLRDSVYAQLCWAIQALGLEAEYKCTVSPMEITKKSTGQKIFFRGCDDPMKSKGIKAPFGYIGILWFEELDQYKGPEAIRTVTQSVIRGGAKCYIFKSFNPPKSATNWANKYIKIPKETMLVTESTYLEVPKQWLGKVFLEEAEYLKEVNPTAYENEYMGVANGSGGNIFDNVEIRAIADEEISQFDRIYFGLDFGWFPDPNAWTKCYYNANRHELYIFDEYRCNKTSNEQMYKILTEEKHMTCNDLLTCDSAEQKSIGDLKAYGMLARGAEKGPGSVEYSMKWLQSLTKIVIDNARCPNSAEEFMNYEYERDKEGNIISGYPDKDNHFIDSIRYALNKVWKKKGQ